MARVRQLSLPQRGNRGFESRSLQQRVVQTLFPVSGPFDFDEERRPRSENFLQSFNQPTYRGMRVNGVRVATWSSRHGWSGM